MAAGGGRIKYRDACKRRVGNEADVVPPDAVLPKLKDVHAGWEDRWWPQPMDSHLRASLPAFQPRLAAE
jgi:hypothetical protein